MSTLCKLNPKVRQDRTARASLVAGIAQEARVFLRNFGEFDKRTQRFLIARDFLRHISRSPQRSGQRKNEIFKQVARELAHG